MYLDSDSASVSLSPSAKLAPAIQSGDPLDQARRLFMAGYVHAAAAMVRSVLEKHLRALCQQRGCRPDDAKKTISAYLGAMLHAGNVDAQIVKRLRQAVRIGNRAAHLGPVTADAASTALEIVSEFLDSHPLVEFESERKDHV